MSGSLEDDIPPRLNKQILTRFWQITICIILKRYT